MRRSTKLVREGNSWSVRLTKPILQASGLQPDTNSEALIIARPGKITIYSSAVAKKLAGQDKYDVAKQDARQVWDEAFEEVWLEIFGVNE